MYDVSRVSNTSYINKIPDGQFVACQAQPYDNTFANRRQVTMVPEGFAGVYVGDVHLYRRSRYRQQRVSQSDAGVGQRTGVDHDTIDGKTQFVNLI